MAPYFSIAWIVYVEHVGKKRQLGGRKGERKYLYPRTSPIKTALRKSLLIFSCFPRTTNAAREREHRRADILRVWKRKIRPNCKNNIYTIWILLSPKPE
jgi:hypothetical protein